MESQEAYNQYKGKKVKGMRDHPNKNATGIVCGYDPTDDTLIIKMTIGVGWKYEDKQPDDKFGKGEKNNPKGYWYVLQKRVIL